MTTAGNMMFFSRLSAPPSLPYDARVEYLESTGTQWIDTLANPLGSPTVHIGMELINSADEDYLGNTNLGGVTGSSLFIADFADYKLQYYRYASVYSVAATGVISTGTFHDFVIGKSVYVDGTLAYTSPNTYIHDASQTNIMLFKSGRGNPASFRCSYFKLYDGETVVRDFIPVRFTNEHGVSEGAMYDRVSGQLFRNAGTGAFTIGPDKSSWTNPYVTDGLVAMWDGEWNAGPGVHDANVTTWVDLSGNGYDIAIPSSGAVWGDDKISLTATSLSTDLPQVSRPAFTIECVAESSGSSGAYVWLRNPSWVGGAILCWVSSSMVCYCPWFGVGRLPGQSLAVKTITWNSADQVIYQNGTAVQTSHGTIDSRNVLSKMFIGEYNGAKISSMGCRNVRLYSRALTGSEIAANYAIDKARFNLP